MISSMKTTSLYFKQHLHKGKSQSQGHIQGVCLAVMTGLPVP